MRFLDLNGVALLELAPGKFIVRRQNVERPKEGVEAVYCAFRGFFEIAQGKR